MEGPGPASASRLHGTCLAPEQRAGAMGPMTPPLDVAVLPNSLPMGTVVADEKDQGGTESADGSGKEDGHQAVEGGLSAGEEGSGGGGGEGELIVQDIRALTSRITVEALLRPRSEELLEGIQERAPGYLESIRALRDEAEAVRAQVTALRHQPAIRAILSQDDEEEDEEQQGGGGMMMSVSEWLDGLLESMVMTATMTASRLQHVHEALQQEVQERERLVAHYAAQEEEGSGEAPGSSVLCAEDYWSLLGERLKYYGASRLAEMVKDMGVANRSQPGGIGPRSLLSSPALFSDEDDDEDDGEEDEEGGEGGGLDWEAASVDARAGAMEAMVQQVETQARRVAGLQEQLRLGEEEARNMQDEAVVLEQRLPKVEERVQELVSALRCYAAFRLGMAGRAWAGRRVAGAWVQWRAAVVLLEVAERRRVEEEAAKAAARVAEEQEPPPWEGKGLGPEAEAALGWAYGRLQGLSRRVAGVEGEVEEEVGERQELLCEVGFGGSDGLGEPASLGILLFDDDDDQDPSSSAASASFRAAVQALLGRAKSLAAQMVQDMFRELEDDQDHPLLALAASSSSYSYPTGAAPAADGVDGLPPVMMMMRPPLPPPPAVSSSAPSTPVPLLLEPLSSSALDGGAPSTPRATAASPLPLLSPLPVGSPPASSSSFMGSAGRRGDDEGFMEAVRQRLAAQGDTAAELEAKVQEQRMQVKGLKRRLDAMRRMAAHAACISPPTTTTKTSTVPPQQEDEATTRSDGPRGAGAASAEAMERRVRLFATARLVAAVQACAHRRQRMAFWWWAALTEALEQEAPPPPPPQPSRGGAEGTTGRGTDQQQEEQKHDKPARGEAAGLLGESSDEDREND